MEPTCTDWTKSTWNDKENEYKNCGDHIFLQFFIYMTTFVILFFIIKIVISKNFLFFTSAARFKGVDLPRRGRRVLATLWEGKCWRCSGKSGLSTSQFHFHTKKTCPFAARLFLFSCVPCRSVFPGFPLPIYLHGSRQIIEYLVFVHVVGFDENRADR